VGEPKANDGQKHFLCTHIRVISKAVCQKENELKTIRRTWISHPRSKVSDHKEEVVMTQLENSRRREILAIGTNCMIQR